VECQASRSGSSDARPCPTAQVYLKEQEADILFSQYDVDGDDKLDPGELHALMLAMNHGDPVSDWAVDFVLATADVETNGLVALAWASL
jgi:hypothetical protein